jgi:hypothetical protein
MKLHNFKAKLCGDVAVFLAARGLIFRHCLLANIYVVWPSPLYRAPSDRSVLSLEASFPRAILTVCVVDNVSEVPNFFCALI